jgi:N-acetylglucosamine kinase-like BadF-type ATPase
LLSRQALRAALRQEEGWGPPTALREALVEAGSGERRVRDVNDLMHRFYTGEFSRAQVAGWSRIVEDLALRGDAVAQELLNAAAQSLAVIAGAVRRNLFGEEGATSAAGSVDVRYCGGMFRCRAIAARFQMLLEMDHRTRVSPPVYESAAGALLEAFRIAGAQLTLKNVPHPEP